MLFLIEFSNAIRDFIEAGGQVLLVIGILIFTMWLMILERIFYYLNGHRTNVKETRQRWQQREDKSSWNAEQIRQAMISRVSLALGGNLPVIKALVALCPLLGLMGTVTGMIEVFDVIYMADMIEMFDMIDMIGMLDVNGRFEMIDMPYMIDTVDVSDVIDMVDSIDLVDRFDRSI